MSEPNGEYKLENCQHKSLKEVEMEVSRCACDGGNYMATGLVCEARQIFRVDTRICEHCWIFKDKKDLGLTTEPN